MTSTRNAVAQFADFFMSNCFVNFSLNPPQRPLSCGCRPRSAGRTGLGAMAALGPSKMIGTLFAQPSSTDAGAAAVANHVREADATTCTQAQSGSRWWARRVEISWATNGSALMFRLAGA